MLVPGSMVNMLCVIKVWSKCVETVQATEKADCYALNAESFFAEFAGDVQVR